MMPVSTVLVVTFVAGASFSLACGLVVREWVLAGRSPERTTGSKLRRRRDLFDQAPPTTLSGLLDLAFDRMVVESGTELEPSTVFQLMVALSLVVGGGAWLYTDEPMAGVIGATCGLLIPAAWLTMLRTRRQLALREQLPHVVDLLARATRAGRSIEQALALVATEAGGLLGREFQRAQQQLEVGRSFEKALKSLAARVPLMEMRLLATTLIVQRQSGGPLSETLDRMVTVIRDRLNAQRQVKASTAAGRMSTLIVASIAPLAVIFLFAFQREHLQTLFDDSLGRTMLLVALVLEILGLMWVALLLRTDN